MSHLIDAFAGSFWGCWKLGGRGGYLGLGVSLYLDIAPQWVHFSHNGRRFVWVGRWQLFARHGAWFMSIEENMKRGRGLSFFKRDDLDAFFFCSSFCLLD